MLLYMFYFSHFRYRNEIASITIVNQKFIIIVVKPSAEFSENNFALLLIRMNKIRFSKYIDPYFVLQPGRGQELLKDNLNRGNESIPSHSRC